MLIQQGDVLITKISKIPNDAKLKPPSSRGHVLADGETTGHAHVISDIGAVEMFESDNALYMRVLRETELHHEEHNTITKEYLLVGDYIVGRVQEYDHFLEEAKNVQD